MLNCAGVAGPETRILLALAPPKSQTGIITCLIHSAASSLAAILCLPFCYLLISFSDSPAQQLLICSTCYWRVRVMQLH